MEYVKEPHQSVLDKRAPGLKDSMVRKPLSMHL